LAFHRAEVDCNAGPLAVRHARRFVATALQTWDLAGLVERIELLTSELVTNAIIHGRSPIRLAVEAHSGSVKIEVQDASTQAPLTAGGEASAEAGGGRGLVLVNALSDQWGWRKVEGGKVVWCTLRAILAARAEPSWFA
jgi:anti-sigma regulatory factor (Ser/Thr protein kinase)